MITNVAGHLPAGASGQVRSACGRFAVIAAAGELATEYGLTGWPQGEATRAAVTCFQAWLEQRGTAGDHDLEKGIQQVISYVERHGASRFEDLNSQGFTVHNRVGFRKCDNRPCEGWRYEYLVLPEAWSEELCKGYNAKTIADEMVRRNLLVPQSGRPTQVVACGSYGRRRVYRLRLEEPDDRPEEQRRQDMIDKMMSDETCGTGLLNGHATNDNQPEATEQPVGQPVLN